MTEQNGVAGEALCAAPSTDRTLLDRPQHETGSRLFWWSAGALAFILVAFLPWIDNGYVAIPDEGIYSAQAANLANGSWTAARPWPAVDSTGAFTNLTGAEITGNGQIPYSRHPAYPLLLVVGYWAAGQSGMLMLSVLGTWLAAIAAGLIARQIKPEYDVWALMATGLATPLLFDAYIVVGHSLAAALAGFAFLATHRGLNGRTGALLYAVPAVIGMVLLRSEGLLFALALGSTISMSALQSQPSRRVRFACRPAALGVGLIVLALATYVVDTRWARATAGVAGHGTDAKELVLSERTGPLSAAWTSLASPVDGTWLGVEPWRPLCILFTILGAIFLRLLPRFPLLGLSAFAVSAACGIAQLWSEPDFVTGLFAATPWLLAGLLLLRMDSLRVPLVARAVGTSSVFTIGILLTIYKEGGATEWGGRFFHILIPTLVPVALLGLDTARRLLRPPEQCMASAALLIVCMSIGATALRVNHDSRLMVADIVGDSTEILADARRTSANDVVLVSLVLQGGGTSRYFWQHSGEQGVLNGRRLPDFVVLLKAAAAEGRIDVISTGDFDADFMKSVLGESLAEQGWAISDLGETSAGTHSLVLFSRTAE